MNEELITIAKKPGIKNCIRINNENDIPDFLSKSIKVVDKRNGEEGKELSLDCLEGEERAPLGSVIAYETLKDGKMNVWNKANWKETTREIDGVFYEIPKVFYAARVTDTIPQSIIDGLGDKFKILPTGEFQIQTDWGIVTCEPNNGYIVIYGTKEDGSLDANFVTKGTPSFEQYYVVDKNGNNIEPLAEYDRQFSKTKNK